MFIMRLKKNKAIRFQNKFMHENYTIGLMAVLIYKMCIISDF